MTPRLESAQPSSQDRVRLCETWKRCPGAVDQERSKIGITPLADPEEPRFPAGRMLAGHESEPSSKISRLVERFRPSDSRDERRCVEGADARDGCQPPRHLVGPRKLGKLQVERINAAIEGGPFRAHVDQEFAEPTKR